MAGTTGRWVLALGAALVLLVALGLGLALLSADRYLKAHGFSFVSDHGPVARVDLPAGWGIHYVNIRWGPSTFGMWALKNGRRVTIVCNTRQSALGREDAYISAHPEGYQEIQAPGGRWLVKWDNEHGGCWALARSRPVTLICSVGTSRTAALRLLKGVTFRPSYGRHPIVRRPMPRKLNSEESK